MKKKMKWTQLVNLVEQPDPEGCEHKANDLETPAVGAKERT
jgi:hypothetical protein